MTTFSYWNFKSNKKFFPPPFEAEGDSRSPRPARCLPWFPCPVLKRSWFGCDAPKGNGGNGPRIPGSLHWGSPIGNGTGGRPESPATGSIPRRSLEVPPRAGAIPLFRAWKFQWSSGFRSSHFGFHSWSFPFDLRIYVSIRKAHLKSEFGQFASCTLSPSERGGTRGS